MFKQTTIRRMGNRTKLYFQFVSLFAPGLFFSIFFANAGVAFAQNVKYTKGNTDSALRSSLTVDPSTLGMSIQLPLASYPGRGGETPVVLRYSSKQWRVNFMDHFNTTITKTRTEAFWSEDAVAGWTTSLDLPKVIVPSVSYRGPYNGTGDSICTTGCTPAPPPTDPVLYINRLLVRMPDGSSHELRKDDSYTTSSGPDSGTYYAVDGSNLRYDTSTSTLFLPDGSRYLLSVSSGTQAQYVDRNGNTLTYTFSTSEWTDTLGRTLKLPFSNGSTGYVDVRLPGFGDSAGSNPTNYSLLYKLRWEHLSNCLSSGSVRVIGDYDYIYGNNPQQHNVASLFTKFSVTDYVVSDGSPYTSTYFDPIVLKEIILPNGRSYTFSYNIYGEIDKVTYPTGGYEEFAYGTVPALSGGLDTFVYNQANRGVTQRSVSPTGNSADEVNWTYAVDTTNAYLVRVTDPYSVKSERLLHRTSANQQFGFDDARTGMAYEERAISASSQMLRRSLTKWTAAGPSPAYPAGVYNATRNPRVTKTVEILLDTGGNALARTTEMTYDNDLNVIETKRYDYASITQAMATSQPANTLPATINSFIDSFSLGTLINTEKTLFLLSDSAYSGSWTAYRNRNLLSLPTAMWVENASGTIVARTEMAYDEAAYAPLSNAATATQWSDPATVRGTATTARRWLNMTTDPATGTTTTYTWPSGQWLTTHAQTDVCGSVRKAWDARGKMTEIKYDGNFSDGANHNAYAYPTQTLTPPPYTGGAGGLGVPYATNQSLTTGMVYDFATGKPISVTDPNGQTAISSYTGDALNRLTKVTRPTGGGETIYEYNDTPGACACDTSVKTRTMQSAGVYVEDYVFFDGAGRAWRSAHGEGGGKWSVKDTQYDDQGRVSKVANPALTGVLAGAPVRGSFALVTANVTTTAYDTLSRLLTLTTPDGSVVTTGYSGNQVTVADQANGVPNPINSNNPRNTTRRSTTDALGRLTQVVEAPGSLGYTSDYTYDALGNLRQVSQGAQSRYFLYDSASRLVRARNPEQDANAAYNLTDPVTGTGNNQWVIKYAYDENGNLLKRWDARGVTAAYNYDDLNRNYAIGYSGGTPATPAIERYYDGATRGKGRPWRTISYNAHPVTGQAAYQYNEITNYDENGRPAAGSQWFLNSAVQWVTYPMSQSYDLMGHVTSQSYPSTRAANYSYGAGGRLGGFSGTLGDGVSRTYADQMAYNAAGQMTSERFGTQTSLYHTMNYNLRQQMWANMLGTSAAGWNRGLLLTYYSLTARSLGAPGGDYSGNNGNVWMQEHYVPANDAISTHTIFRDLYEYDDLNRLKQDTGWQKDVANNWTSPHQQAYNYDQWGNRTFNTGATWGANIPNLSFTASATTNRLDKSGGSTCTGTKSGMCYDAAGNQIFDNFSATSGGDREYDGDSRMTKAAGVGGSNYYVYDGNGSRVRRIVGGVEYWQVYGFGGELMAEYPVNGVASMPQKEYGYRGGQMLMVAGCDVARWLVNDHLGTPRIEVEVVGSLAAVKRHDYLPFGEELVAGMGNSSLRSSGLGYGTDCVRQKFSGKERDNETGLDHFGARYYTSIQGRFTSVDPVQIKLSRLIDPQRINLYAYVRNSPLTLIDPDGRDIIVPIKKDTYLPGPDSQVIAGLVRIARTEVGRRLLQKFDDAEVKVVIDSGTITTRDGAKAYGRAKGNIKGGFEVTLDFGLAERDREKNNSRKKEDKIQNVPNNDSEQEGHELIHIDEYLKGQETSLNHGTDEDEDKINKIVRGILGEKKTYNEKDSEAFVRDLIKPKPEKKDEKNKD